MLVELRVSQLGVIEDLTVVLGPGLTALTGETGAGKTLLVDAIQLLTGGPADNGLVRPGAKEALVEGRFVDAAGMAGGGDEGGADGAGPGVGDEVVLTRLVPASGRSRCYVDGRMVSLSRLAGIGRRLVDIHGQHAHQSLLSPAVQRSALDRAGRIDLSEMEGWRRRLRELRASSAALGGDARTRARQLDLLSYQLREIDAASVEDADEERRLIQEEETLADATGLVEAAGSAWQALAGEDGVIERLGHVVASVTGRRPLDSLRARLAALQDEMSDAAAEARTLAETVEADPARLEAIGERRRVLTELRRKYGPSLEEVISFREELRTSVDELLSHDERAAAIEAELAAAEKELAAASETVRAARRAAAPVLGRAVESELRKLAMPRARFEVDAGGEGDPDTVTWLLGANPGEPLLPLAKVGSGGELARAMLAARLCVGRLAGGGADPGPATLVFDEVDAGIGGEAAAAVGQALAALAGEHQVLVVTHLAQVAAFAGSQLVVSKEVTSVDGEERTVARARPLDGSDRVVELARMLSGRPGSDSARRHAQELLSAARSSPSDRGRAR